MVFDLLGDPVRYDVPKRGRPQHEPTDEKRRLVIQLASFDWSDERIAMALGVDPKTLRKHYSRQLAAKEEARARVEAKLLNALWGEIEKGNVSAIDRYFKRLDQHELGKLSERVAARGVGATGTGGAASEGGRAAGSKMGKKEQQRAAAHEVTGKFAPPPGPRTVN